ncbi:Histone-lysine N-methyltransferase SETMAR [Eumeta japonica]|uniref:Histone-lysine N-methyltransferase SETMAR n=1 Tax=Eumeta variegata TaxID=151549 RepID=A0A4C1XIS8_EUMVA|nr:Histone-lysine N-methyltransferase SETMAR [Eumeta japonica]
MEIQWLNKGQLLKLIVKRGRFEQKACYVSGENMKKYLGGSVNRKWVLVQYVNATLHTVKFMYDKIVELCGVERVHPAFSPDLAPSDRYLFRPMAKFFYVKKFESEGDVENAVQQFLAHKPEEWFYHKLVFRNL